MRRSHFVDLTPLRHSPAFARLWIGQAIAGIGGQLTIVAVGLHIYQLTGSTLAVAFVGVIALGPTVIAGLYGGALADAFDRRRLALGAAIVAWAATATIATLAWLGAETVGTLYALTAVTAAASTVISATSSAITPRLLPRELLPAASALNGISSGVSITLGPALAGVLVASVGYGWTYSLDVLLFAAAFAGIVRLPALAPDPDAGRAGFRAVGAGLRFLATAPNIRMNFLVDIVAMVFGQPRVLFPALGVLVLGGGPVTVGALTASFALGALLSGLFSGRLGEVRRHGRAIGWAVQAYGVAIAAFGCVVVVTVATGGNVAAAGEPASLLPIVLAAVTLAAAGAADNVSAVYRSTMLQAAVPDAYRGRLQGVFIVVVTGGPRVGDLYVGLVASLGLLWLPPAVGGVLIIALTALLVARSRPFRAYDSLDPRP